MNSPLHRTVTALLSTLFAAACATPSQYRPVIDTKDMNMSRYEQDLRECQQYAYQIDVANTTAATAAVGAGVLGALAAVLGGNRYDVGRWAAAGAVTGGVNGAAAGAQTQVDIIRNCMQGRGYKVLARDATTEKQMLGWKSSVGRSRANENIS